MEAAIAGVSVLVFLIVIGTSMDRFYGDTSNFFLIAMGIIGILGGCLTAAIVAYAPV